MGLKPYEIRIGRKQDPGAYYIGRGSPLGNPHRIGENGMTRDQVCDLFAQELWYKVRNRKDPNLEASLRELDLIRHRGPVTLGCYCSPERCHGEAIAELIESAEWQEFEATVEPLFGWRRYGGYEVSSVGDRDFSALYARLPDGRTIEEAYQLDVKGWREYGYVNWRDAKGKPPIRKITRPELEGEYVLLWTLWLKNNPNALTLLRKRMALSDQFFLSDRFATSEINQAAALTILLNNETLTQYCRRP